MLPREHPSSELSERTSTLRLPGSILQGILARIALAFLRIYLGTILVIASVPKLRGGFAPGLEGFLHQVALQKAPDFYRRFVEQAVLPHAAFFAGLVPGTELTIGVTLILGLGTRLSAAAALVLLVNYMLAKGTWFWYPSSNDAAWAAVSLALIIGAAGRTFGVDAMLARRWPRSPLW
jgi:uncharacterized membrane protein YphA (DoxX/SURF4 family)